MNCFRFGLCLAGLVCCLSGCGKAPEASAPKPGSPAQAGPKPTDEKANFPPLAAGALTKEYTADQAAAIDKYKNKAVQISGTVIKKVGDGSDRTYIVVKADDAAIQCELAIIDNYTKFRIKTLKEGDTVSVLGEPSSSGLEKKPDGSMLLTMMYCKLLP